MVDGVQVQVMRDETELESVRRARDSILANISHEFRTPLAAQLASIELLQDNLHGMPRAQLEELVASLQRGTLRLTRLIDNLLESVRIESGQLGIRRQPVQLAEVVRDAAELVAGLLPQRGQALEIDVPDDLPEVVGDAPRLTQVFVNLLANANKFGPEGSTIRVGGDAAPTRSAAWVEDEGPGVTEDDHGSIFERFHRSRRRGAGAARARARTLDREVDRRPPRRPGGRGTHRDGPYALHADAAPAGTAADEDPDRRRRCRPARAGRLRADAGGVRRGQGRRRGVGTAGPSPSRRPTSRSSTSTCRAAAASTSARRSASSRGSR